MGKHIFEEGPMRGHAAGNTSIEQQASQLVSDIKYKVRKKMKETSGSNLSPAQVQGEYRKLFNASGASGAVKSLARKRLFGEQVDLGITPVSEHVKDSASYIFTKVFLEGNDQKFVIRVTDKATGNTSYRKADRAKIAELRANPNISSVEITGRKEADPTDDEKSGGKKAKKDYDGDGKVESGAKEYRGSVHNAIQRKKGLKPDGKDTSSVKEEVIYEKEENGEKKLDVMKGKNTIKVNPTIGESIRAKLDALKAEKIEEQEAVTKQQQDEKKKEQLAQQQAKKDKNMRIRILRNKMMAARAGTEVNASHNMEGNFISEGEEVRYCPKCEKEEKRSECAYGEDYWDKNSRPSKDGDEDPRGMRTKINLAKNKLRSMGLKMSYDMEGDQINERTRYAKETGKDPQTGKPSVKGGNPPPAAMRHVEKELRSTGGLMSSRRKPIQPQGKKKVPGAKGPKGVTPVDRIKGQLARKRAPKPDMGSRFD